MNREYLIKEQKIIDEPFYGDLWNREDLAFKLTRYIENLNVGATIAIDAEWGAGKSWFVKNWKDLLEKNDFNVIYLDAFSNDFLEDPFLLISMEIAKKLEQNKTYVTNLKDSIGAAYRAILPNAPMLLWALTTTLIGAGHFHKAVGESIGDVKESLGELGKEAGTLLDEKLKEYLSQQVENYNNEHNSLDYFKQELAKVANGFDKPLVFIIDELDRCKPEFSIRFIERIKHFFDIEKVVFVLAVNKNQLEESINSYYGFSKKNSYLEKFIDFNLKLVKPPKINYEIIIRKYSNDLGFRINNIEDLRFLFDIFKPNARQVIKIIQKLSFLNVSHFVSATYATLYMLSCDLDLLESHHDDKEILDLFFEKVRQHLSKSLTRPINLNDPESDIRVFERAQTLCSDGIQYLLKFYQDICMEQNLEDAKKLRIMFSPLQRPLSTPLSFEWDGYLHNGFVINS